MGSVQIGWRAGALSTILSIDSRSGNPIFQPPTRIGYHIRLRRISAFLLLAVFSFGLLAPAFAAGADSNLPSCCRRAGRHHCATPAGHADAQDGAGVGAKSVCPLYQQISAVQVRFAKSLRASASSSCALGFRSAARDQRSTLCIPAFPGHVHLQRGPPPFSSLS